MITVDIVTPSRKLVVGETAESVTVPTVSGEIMVLPGHTELVTLLDTGGLYLQKPGGMRQFAVSAGFGVVRDNKVTILAEQCEEAHEIDRHRAELAEKKAQEFLLESVTEEMLNTYRLKLKKAQVRKQLSQNAKKPPQDQHH